MKQKHSALLILLTIVMWSAAASAWAQHDQSINELNKIIDAKLAIIDTWNRNATLLGFLTLIVAIAGAMSAFLSHANAKWAKKIVLIAGICVAAIPVITNLFYSVDYKTYKKLSFSAQSIIDEMRLQIAQLPNMQDGAARNKIINENIYPKLTKFNNLGSQLLDGENANSPSIKILDFGNRSQAGKNGWSLFGISEAFAAFNEPMSPQWVTQPPKFSNALLFVGFGKANDPAEAEKMAIKYAKEIAESDINDILQESGQNKDNPANQTIVKNIIDNFEIINKFVKFEANSNQYRYFCLLKINIDIVQVKLGSLPSQEPNITVPPNFINLLRTKAKP